MVLLSNGWTLSKTNVPRHPWVFISLSSVPSFLSPSSTHPSPPPSPPGSRKDTLAFMPHYRRFETRHGGPMSFFIALLLAAWFTEPGGPCKSCHGAIPQKVVDRVPYRCRYRTAGRQPSSFLHEKLSLNLKAGWVLPSFECLVNVMFGLRAIGRDRKNSDLSTIKREM